MTADLVSLVALVLFVVGLLLAAGSITFRLVHFVRRGIPRPRLIWRDGLVFGGLAVTFVAVGIHSAVGRPFDEELWWRVGTGLLAVASVWTRAYFELFVIGHRRDAPPEVSEGEQGTRIQTHGPSTITVEPDGAQPEPEQ